MWIMVPGGFVSIVQKYEDRIDKEDTLTVRSRDRQSLVNFLKLADAPADRAEEKYGTDYPYRAVMTRYEVKEAVENAVNDITYDNFKDAAKEQRPGVYVRFLTSVWSSGLNLTPRAVERRMNNAWKIRG